MNEIKKQAVWVFGGTCVIGALQVIQLGFLARTLSVTELGILAIINAILAVAMVLQDMGMSSYVVHRQQLTRKEQSTIYWVNTSLGLITSLLLIVLAWPISIFYAQPRLLDLIILASLNFSVLGCLSQYQAHFIKVKKVILLSKIEVFSKLISVIFTVALLYFSSLTISSVILGLLVNALIRISCMIFFAEPTWHPTFSFCKSTCKSAIKYGSFQLGSQIINQLRTQADSLVVGKVLGADMLGIYSLAKELVLQPLKFITPVINRLALPRFAEKQNSNAEVKSLFLKATFTIVGFSAVMYLSIGILSPTIVSILYGHEHISVASLLPLMLIFGLLRPMGGVTGALSQANGRTNIEFYWNIVASIVVLAVLGTTMLWSNVYYVAASLSIAQILISIFVFPFFIKPVVGVGFFAYIKQWIWVVVAFILIILVIDHYNLYIRLF
ncbi:lipopolysaccharide biosynthesis protein [Gibbsiella quercinecans]|uniref:lipopolysaccharide biosynthesis protein n=1 Tax=Gibbsiella quercinecans TaxID=929813 RepID=UPI000EF25445|nr:lipopolysaccharide biosynthesis protein [Gibbsiella quercinecans]RLM03735.1 lipopolysaccharide biosynthesis protein [Gibbsiella quercinecans]